MADTAARLASRSLSAWAPTLAAFDFGTAFSAIAQYYVQATLVAAGLPVGFRNLVNDYFRCVLALTRSNDGSWTVLFQIASGIVQGCSLSGLLFALASDPYLNLFSRCFQGSTRIATFACADDLAIAVWNIDALRKTAASFRFIERLTRLRLKFSKCTLVPLSRQLPADFVFKIDQVQANRPPIDCLNSFITSNASFEDISRWTVLWIQRFIPSWSAVRIDSCVEYLGAIIGPSARCSQWTKTLMKWESRALLASSTPGPPSVATHMYNTYALSTLGYLGQFLAPPLSEQNFAKLCFLERQLQTRVLKMPFTAFSLAGLLNLHQWGGFSCRSALCTLAASMLRASCCTLSWAAAAAELRHISEQERDNLVFASEWQGELWPSCWDSSSIAFTLESASRGSFSSRRLSDAARVVLHETRIAQSSFFDEFPNNKFPFQKVAYRLFLRELFPDDIPSILARRFARFAPDGVPREDIFVTSLCEFACTLPQAIAHQCLRAWAGGWCTTGRFC